MQGLTVPYTSFLDLSLDHKFDNSTHHVLPTGRTYTTIASVLGHMHLAEGNGSYHAALLHGSHRTTT